MPVWTVRTVGGEDERVEAGLLATECGALVALSDEGTMVAAWAPGEWRTVRHVSGTFPVGGFDREEDDVLVGLRRG
jgi:hypothetical protein